MTRVQPRHVGLAAAIALVLLAAACGAGDEAADGEPTPAATATGEAEQEVTLRLYTSVTQDTVDAVTERFQQANPNVTLDVFRAPTGELNARVNAERREGEIQADVFWLTDPLSMQPFAEQGLLREWTPANAEAIPEAFRTDTFWGTRLLNLVIVARDDLEATPTSWDELAGHDFEQPVALPDPGFAGSAFGALGFFALDDRYGFEFYETMADSGVTQVQAPGEVVSGVAEGRFSAGMTLDRMAREAEEAGSPVQMVWPEPGAVAVYSPIGVLATADAVEPAEAFTEFVLSVEAQNLIAETGWQPANPEADWPHQTGDTVSPDWSEGFARQDELLEKYRAIIGE
jgi:iron(III) transport system substrate-binding protein